MNEGATSITIRTHEESRLPLDTPLGHKPLCASDAKRSVQNILRWNSYLPTDCVKTMVRLGWDYTT